MIEFTTLRISKETKKRLEDLGHRTKSHDDLLNDILDVFEREKKLGGVNLG